MSALRRYRGWSDFVRGERLHRGESQASFAKRLGVSRAVVAHWECDHNLATFERVCRVADALNVRLEIRPMRGLFASGIKLAVCDIAPGERGNE